MLVLKSVKTKKRLVLGNYVSVHVSAVNSNQTHLETLHDLRVQREEFFQRIEKERPELKGVRRSRATMIKTMINKGNQRREVLPNTLLQRKAG